MRMSVQPGSFHKRGALERLRRDRGHAGLLRLVSLCNRSTTARTGARIRGRRRPVRQDDPKNIGTRSPAPAQVEYPRRSNHSLVADRQQIQAIARLSLGTPVGTAIESPLSRYEEIEMRSTFRAAPLTALAGILASDALAADAAKDYPVRPVRLIVAQTPGSSIDTIPDCWRPR